MHQNARQYNYNLQIRNSQQDTNERMYAKSNDIFKISLGLNALARKKCSTMKERQLKEIETEKQIRKKFSLP